MIRCGRGRHLKVKRRRRIGGEDLAKAFRAIGWSKPSALFLRYCEEEASGARWTCVAERGGAIAGYVTLAWSSTDPELARRGIPEIMDLNVLPSDRR